MMEKTKADFSTGSIPRHMLKLAFPIFVAELVHVTYNIVDRMFIGHISGSGTLALSGVGIVFPLISFINAFASMTSSGGSPLFSIRRGQGDIEGARSVLETSYTFIAAVSLCITLLFLVFMDPALVLMGADDVTLPFARDYFSIYVIGTIFTLLSLGLNPFITASGSPVTAMLTVMIGAATNIVLDPLFIFVLGLGVKGAALATVISQAVSAVWVTLFFTGRKTVIKMERLRIVRSDLVSILKLGVSGMMFKMTNSVTQALCNITLKAWAGTQSFMYIGAMSIINSLREVIHLPITSISTSAQPIMGYNYGAKKNSRIRTTIRTATILNLSYGLFVWAVVMLFPSFFFSIFTPDRELVELTVPCARIFFAAFFMMSFQSAGQNTFVSLNCPRRAVFFSLFRKIILVAPLTILLPYAGLGVKGVFLAEMISQIIGGACCWTTMFFTIYQRTKKYPDGEKAVL